MAQLSISANGETQDSPRSAPGSESSSSDASSWRPLLDGSLAERAIDAIEAIAANLRVDFPDNPSLASGDAGLALLYAYLEQAGLGQGHDETAVTYIGRAINSLSGSALPASLYGGFTGIAWAVEHLKGGPLDPDQEDANSEIDEALKEQLGRSPWTGEYDLVSGLVGFGVYALESLPRPVAAECLERIVDRLDETAEHNSQGVTWYTGPDLLPDWQRDLCPNGYYNLGLAHGVPGVIALLGQVLALESHRSFPLVCSRSLEEKTRFLLEGACRWLIAQKLPENKASSFGAWRVPGREEEASRLAWCYGDPGIAAALLGAARALGEPAWEQSALEIARRAARRPVETAGVVDAGLCHGAAGLGHVFNRMYQATGDTSLSEAALRWFERTLDMRRPEGGVAGFSAREVVDDEPRWVASPGLLTGAAGIALTLLAATTPFEPAWDRMLLVSIPERI